MNQKKLIVITLFYTTLSVLVQGKMTDCWVKKEYKNTWEVVDKIMACRSKGDNPDVDKLLSEVKLCEPFNADNKINESNNSIVTDENQNETKDSDKDLNDNDVNKSDDESSLHRNMPDTDSIQEKLNTQQEEINNIT